MVTSVPLLSEGMWPVAGVSKQSVTGWNRQRESSFCGGSSHSTHLKGSGNPEGTTTHQRQPDKLDDSLSSLHPSKI